MSDIFEKRRERMAPTFANINLLGRCNYDCYFCLGKDIPEIVGQSQLQDHFDRWANFPAFIDRCRELAIPNIYITGQNTDALLYGHLPSLIHRLKQYGFRVGIRTNGLLALSQMDTLNSCTASVGLSFLSYRRKARAKIAGKGNGPDFSAILRQMRPDSARIAIVVNRFNVGEVALAIRRFSKYPAVKYIQVRRIATDTRKPELTEDAEIYEQFFGEFSRKHSQVGSFYGAEVFRPFGKYVCFWRTIKTNIGSINYFTDGTISESYFIVDGYKHEHRGIA